jgi:hypothetical protein
MTWETYFQFWIQKGLISLMYKEVLQISRKEANNLLRPFTEKEP